MDMLTLDYLTSDVSLYLEQAAVAAEVSALYAAQGVPHEIVIMGGLPIVLISPRQHSFWDAFA